MLRLGPEEMVLWSGHTLLVQRTQVQVLGPQPRVVHFRGSWCFWPPWAPSFTCTRLHIHTHIIQNTNKSLLKTWCFKDWFNVYELNQIPPFFTKLVTVWVKESFPVCWYLKWVCTPRAQFASAHFSIYFSLITRSKFLSGLVGADCRTDH